jgi:hypothetical protein
MTHHRFGISKGIVAAATGTLVLAGVLAMSLPAPASPTLLGLTNDQPTTGHCDRTFTGTNGAAITVPSPQTFCMVNLKQTGAITVDPGAGLSVTRGSVINGAVTLNGAKSFAFCESSTVGGAISAATSAGFIIIGNGGDKGLLATPCGANHIDGAVTLNGNLGGVEVGGNSIVGALTVSGNIAPHNGAPTEDNATEIEGNTVGGLTTCATNSPAPTNDGRKNTFTGGTSPMNGQCSTL